MDEPWFLRPTQNGLQHDEMPEGVRTRSETMTEPQDPEIIAMRACWKAIAPFDPAARIRMLQWLAARHNEAFTPEVKGGKDQ